MLVVAATNFNCAIPLIFSVIPLPTKFEGHLMKKNITISDILLVAWSSEMYYSVRLKSWIHPVVQIEGKENKYNSTEYHVFSQ